MACVKLKSLYFVKNKQELLGIHERLNKICTGRYLVLIHKIIFNGH